MAVASALDPAETLPRSPGGAVAGSARQPMVAALTSGTAAGEQLGRLYHRDEPLDEQDLVV
jgi:hypothetical protein